jgi:hypothetical protein
MRENAESSSGTLGSGKSTVNARKARTWAVERYDSVRWRAVR